MKAVFMLPRRGDIVVDDVPAPQIAPGRVLIRNQYSLISAGTERAAVQGGQQSLVGKARQRPEQVKQVLDSVRRNGPMETYRMVNDRLDTPTPLGYSCAGRVAAVGEGVADILPGMTVAAGGAGYACHAEVVSVPANLCVPVPDGLTAEHAAFATVGAIALQGLHQADALPGSRVAVVGLGLLGQLTIRLLAEYGFDVVGVDKDDAVLALAGKGGVTAFSRSDGDLLGRVQRHWGGEWADAVIVTAATKSPDPVELAGQLARDRATVVVVGDVTVAPPRPTYYGKELTLRYSRSYGPGRYDPTYEEGGHSYPAGYVPWPERRNMAEFLRVARRANLLDTLDPLVFPAVEAPAAFALLDAEGADRRVALLLAYEAPDDTGTAPGGNVIKLPAAKPARIGRRVQGRPVRIAAIGAGAFATRMLFPALRQTESLAFTWLTTASGLKATHVGKRWGFEHVVGSVDEGLALDDQTDCVLVLSHHDTHARYAVEVLSRGVSVFCEKPLALTEDELEAVASAWLGSPSAQAMVGFNRRHAPSVRKLRDALGDRSPVQVSYRAFAGALPATHWYSDPAQGGRLIGEVCHFIDTASFLAGSTPARVWATSGDGSSDAARAQSVSLQIGYRNGSTASIVYGGRTPAGAPKEMVEVSADGFAARLDDFASLTVWRSGTERFDYRAGPKGHEEEMSALVAGLRRGDGRRDDFAADLWTSLAACRAAQSLAAQEIVEIEPITDGLRRALLDKDLY